MDLRWHHYTFEQLDVHLLYAILALRQEVFVVEQTCYYQDADGRDQAALHVVGILGDQLMAYTRVLDRGIAYPDYASIGRVVTSPAGRGRGWGRPLMQESLRVLYRHYGPQAVKISAQAHLQDFYGSLGFRPVGEGYEEDGIPHWGMVLPSPI